MIKVFLLFCLFSIGFSKIILGSLADYSDENEQNSLQECNEKAFANSKDPKTSVNTIGEPFTEAQLTKAKDYIKVRIYIQ
ncbi:unnamed protein product [Caenorhabditis angaria]|uniref:Uncharacterized protein n=1 Tax=Caenorhabditis angaria TaxID=860376 RepID=A0A9P1N931_9PELO|nr:unnamed protein product [Caenorhabditis angaria]